MSREVVGNYRCFVEFFKGGLTRLGNEFSSLHVVLNKLKNWDDYSFHL